MSCERRRSWRSRRLVSVEKRAGHYVRFPQRELELEYTRTDQEKAMAYCHETQSMIFFVF